MIQTQLKKEGFNLLPQTKLMIFQKNSVPRATQLSGPYVVLLFVDD